MTYNPMTPREFGKLLAQEAWHKYNAHHPDGSGSYLEELAVYYADQWGAKTHTLLTQEDQAIIASMVSEHLMRSASGGAFAGSEW